MAARAAIIIDFHQVLRGDINVLELREELVPFVAVFFNGVPEFFTTLRVIS